MSNRHSILKLDETLIQDDFFAHAKLFGFMAKLSSYYMCWQLNYMLHVNFKACYPFEIVLNKKNRKYFFSIYEYSSDFGTSVHYLYSNQNDGEYLLPEYRNIDYLWLIKDNYENDRLYELMKMHVKFIEQVQLIVDIPLDTLKHKNNLIF